jgi:signal transduction histidine kinase
MSIRLRLTIYWAAIIGLILVIAGVAVFILFERQQWGALDGALLEEADTAAATISRLGPGAGTDSIVRNLSEERDLGPRRRVRIVSGDRVIADFGDTTSDLPEMRAGHSKAPDRGVRDGARGKLRYALVPFQLGDTSAIFENGVDASAVRKSIARLRTSLLLILPLILSIAVSGGYLLAGRALVPIIALAGELSRIDPRDLSHRLDAGPVNDEVARLTDAINALLDRVERAANTERRFADDAAHELRTPLSVLRTGLEVALGHERSPAEYSDAVASALREVVALCTMADQLLTLARLDQEASLERMRLDLGALIREVVEAVEPLVQAKQLTLATDSAGVATVDGNPIHLRRLVINLIDNALKFTPAHGRVEIGLSVRDGSAILRVADSGPGIPPADLPFIFDRFFRGKARDESGNGLGLSLCREIVRLHHGAIAAANRTGGGCEFVVTLPLAPCGDP